MDKEKKSISITITDISDLNKVMDSLDYLFREILLYYYDNDKKNFNYFVLSFATYIGLICQMAGLDKLEDEGENDK